MMPDELTDDELAELEALEKAATDAPWMNDPGGFIYSASGIVAQSWSKSEEDFPNSVNNRRFAIAARNAFPKLLAAARSRNAWERAVEKQRESLNSIRRSVAMDILVHHDELLRQEGVNDES